MQGNSLTHRVTQTPDRGETWWALHFRKVTRATIWRMEWKKTRWRTKCQSKKSVVSAQVRNDEFWNKGGTVGIRRRGWFWKICRPCWPIDCQEDGEREGSKMTPRCLDGQLWGRWYYLPREGKRSLWVKKIMSSSSDMLRVLWNI